MRTCAREHFGVSACTDWGTTDEANGVIATPTRHFPGHRKYLKCELYGVRFPDFDSAFKAMEERGYNQPYFTRDSVPTPLFAKLRHVQTACRFDALYRLLKWKQRNGIHCLELRDKLRRMAKRVGIFHPVANRGKL